MTGKPAVQTISEKSRAQSRGSAKKRTASAPPREWPATKPELWAISDIRPHPNNPRTHPEDQVQLLAQLMRDFGVDQPIVVDEEGVILKGHGRRLAAIAAEFDQFPVVVHHGLSEIEKEAMRVQDNQVALLAGWDRGRLTATLDHLKANNFNMPMLGFSEVALRGWEGASEQPGVEATPAPPKKPTVKLGDLWHLGEHRLICGDSTKRDTWTRLFGHDRAAMVFTDPPYGVSYEGGEFEVIKGDEKRRDDLYKMLLQAFREMVRVATDRSAFYIWHASSTREDFAQAMKAAGLTERQYLMWVKPAMAFGRADYQWQHEPCFYAAIANGKPAFYGERAESTVWHARLVAHKDTAVTIGNGVLLLDGQGGSLFVQTKAPKSKKLRQVRITDGRVFLAGGEPQTTVWEVGRDSNYEHPTQKPVELARRAIENSSQPGEIVADGFLGSGTTLIGAEITGRRCFGAELDPVYATVIIGRWQKLTGQQATLEGVPFETIAKRRKGKGNGKV